MPRIIDSMSDTAKRREVGRRKGNVYTGMIAEDANDFDDAIDVVVKDYSDKFRHGPCRFPRCNGATLPLRGDDCLVAFDENDDPWIVVWYPGD